MAKWESAETDQPFLCPLLSILGHIELLRVTTSDSEYSVIKTVSLSSQSWQFRVRVLLWTLLW